MPQHPASNCAEAYMVKKDAAQILFNELSTFNLSYDWELAYKMYKRNFNVRWLFPHCLNKAHKILLIDLN